MANLTTYGANAIADGNAIPATLYVKLHVGDPGPDALDNEATSTTRPPFTRTAAVAGVANNADLIEWLLYPAVEILTHVTIWDDATAGNPWLVDAIASTPETVIDQAVEIAAASLVVTFPIWS